MVEQVCTAHGSVLAASDIPSDIALATAANPGKRAKTAANERKHEVVGSASVAPKSAGFIGVFAAMLEDSHPLRQIRSFRFNNLTGPRGFSRAMACNACLSGL